MCLIFLGITAHENRYQEFISGFDNIAPVSFYYENSPYTDMITQKIKDRYLANNSRDDLNKGILEVSKLQLVIIFIHSFIIGINLHNIDIYCRGGFLRSLPAGIVQNYVQVTVRSRKEGNCNYSDNNLEMNKELNLSAFTVLLKTRSFFKCISFCCVLVLCKYMFMYSRGPILRCRIG